MGTHVEVHTAEAADADTKRMVMFIDWNPPAPGLVCQMHMQQEEQYGRRYCMDYLDEAAKVNTDHGEVLMRPLGGVGRPTMCQITPVHPDECEKYECQGFSFERVG